MTKLSWRAASVSNRGRIRSENQDNFYVSPDSCVFAVADGMGGARNGSIASRLAIETIENCWKNEQSHCHEADSAREWLGKAVEDANLTIYGESQFEDIMTRMGTTVVVAAHTADGKVEIAHVGDSRAYLVRNGHAEPVTVDHSVVMEMVLRNQLTPDQAWHSPFKNLLTRCLGHQIDIEVEKTEIVPRRGDWVVLCSDGLNSELRDPEIAKIVSKSKTPEEACESLLAKTLALGARDNVTILAIQYFSTK